MATTPTREQPDRHELTRNLETLKALTETMEEAAARRGISLATLRRKIRSGEVEQIIVGRDVRIWR